MNLLKDPNKRKWVIVATMFIAIICNYLDRQLLSNPKFWNISASATCSTHGSSTSS